MLQMDRGAERVGADESGCRKMVPDVNEYVACGALFVLRCEFFRRRGDLMGKSWSGTRGRKLRVNERACAVRWKKKRRWMCRERQ